MTARTPEERLAALEARQEGTDAGLRDMDDKLDQLLRAAAMGQGAWWAVLKLGGVLVTLGAALIWLGDKIHFFNWPK